MYVPADMAWAFHGTSYYERNVVHWFERLIARMDRPVVFDVGANCGFYTLLLSSRARWVYAFEPVAETFEILHRNLRENGLTNVTPLRLALADTAGPATIKLYSSSANNSTVVTLPRDHPAKLVGEEQIRLATLDDLVVSGEARDPDLIKLDIEGGELDALRGGRETIARARPIMIVENHPEPWFDAGFSRQQLIEEIARHRYDVYGLAEDVDDFELHTASDTSVVNLLAVPSEKADMLF